MGVYAMPLYANVNPLQINQLIDLAVQTHPLVGAAIADKQATTEGVVAAKLNYLPTPALSSQYNRAEGGITRFSISQPLWTGGKLTADVNRAINDDRAAFAKTMERRNEVAKNTIDIWQQYIYALSLQDLYLNNLKQLQEFEAMMQRRVAQGVSAKIELDLITSRILQDQNALQGAIEQQRIAENRLQQVIGKPIVAPMALDVADMTRQAKAASQDFERLAFSSVADNHPSVIRQRFEVESARQEVKSQQAGQMPSIYMQYKNDYHHRNSRFEGDFSVGISYDPGAGLSNLALARASKARVQSLIQSQEAARRKIVEEIQTQYQQFISARDQELSLSAAVAGAQIILNSYRRQFVTGRKSWLEVLNAMREQSEYEKQLRQVQAQMVANFYKLQIDFGQMPWQTQAMTFIERQNSDFNPLEFAKDQFDELKKQSINLNNKTLNLRIGTLPITDMGFKQGVNNPNNPNFSNATAGVDIDINSKVLNTDQLNQTSPLLKTTINPVGKKSDIDNLEADGELSQNKTDNHLNNDRLNDLGKNLPPQQDLPNKQIFDYQSKTTSIDKESDGRLVKEMERHSSTDSDNAVVIATTLSATSPAVTTTNDVDLNTDSVVAQRPDAVLASKSKQAEQIKLLNNGSGSVIVKKVGVGVAKLGISANANTKTNMAKANTGAALGKITIHTSSSSATRVIRRTPSNP